MFSATDLQPGTVGVDIGGTKIAAGYVNASGEAVLLGTAPTTPYDGQANLDTIERLISAPEVADTNLLGVSVATTFNHEGSLRDPRGWFGWKGKVLADLLYRPNRQALVFADAAAGAIGEHSRGAGSPFSQMLYVTVGTGISHSFVIDGKPLNGAHNSAYFSGYTPQARCDRERCDFMDVEKICSGPALAREYSGPDARDARPVISAAQGGEARAVAIVEHAAFHLGALIATMVMMYDPAGVVIGGGLGTGATTYRTRAIEIARSLIITEHGRAIPMKAAELGPSSCWVGAIEMAQQSRSLAQNLSIRTGI